jgi:hypothetical protein
MAINCSSNALLDTLNAKKDLLNSKVASLQSAGAAAMGDLKAKADAMKDSLLQLYLFLLLYQTSRKSLTL